METKVKFIRKFGNHNIGDELMVHPNMKIHLQKIGVVANDIPTKIELKKDVQPIILKPAEPIKIVDEVKPEPIRIIDEVKKTIEIKPKVVKPVKKAKKGKK